MQATSDRSGVFPDGRFVDELRWGDLNQILVDKLVRGLDKPVVPIIFSSVPIPNSVAICSRVTSATAVRTSGRGSAEIQLTLAGGLLPSDLKRLLERLEFVADASSTWELKLYAYTKLRFPPRYVGSLIVSDGSWRIKS